MSLSLEAASVYILTHAALVIPTLNKLYDLYPAISNLAVLPIPIDVLAPDTTTLEGRVAIPVN